MSFEKVLCFEWAVIQAVSLMLGAIFGLEEKQKEMDDKTIQQCVESWDKLKIGIVEIDELQDSLLFFHFHY